MRWLKLTLVALVLATGAAFTIQNSGRTTQLSLDVGLYAWKLDHPATVSAIVWASFAIGFALAGTWGVLRAAALARKVRQLEQQVALGSARSTTDGWK